MSIDPTKKEADSHYDADDQEVNYFAETNFRGDRRRFGIKLNDRRRHMYVIGKTGMGKSTMLENMIIQDIQSGKGLAVVDPHGDLVEKVINYIPSHRINDVIYFNPSDLHHPIAFNILEQVSDEYKNLVSNGLVGVFKKIWADSWGPRLEYILINAILALLEYPGSTLLGVTRMLVDTAYRKKVVNNVKDPVVKSFWVNEYNNYSEKFRNEAISPIQNKVGQFLSSSLIRNIVGQPKSTINMREIMDSGKILLMNLSKGRIGEENAALLGAMMITKIQLAAMSRVDIPEKERRDFFLYVDEFQNFSTDSFAGILSEARKYRLDLIMAHQYIEQLSDEVRAAVFGNVGTLVTFRVGATDAEELEKEFQPTFMQEHLVQLPSYHTYLRLMIDGVASEPFSATTLPPVSGENSNAEKVITVSRERYSRNRQEVEGKIARWAGVASGGEIDDSTDDSMDMSEELEEGVHGDEGDAVEPFHRAVMVQRPTIAAGDIPLPPPLAPQQQEPQHDQDELMEYKRKGISFVTPPPEWVPYVEPTVAAVAVPEVREQEVVPVQEPVRKEEQKKPIPVPESMPQQTSSQATQQTKKNDNESTPSTGQKKKRRRRRKKSGATESSGLSGSSQQDQGARKQPEQHRSEQKQAGQQHGSQQQGNQQRGSATKTQQQKKQQRPQHSAAQRPTPQTLQPGQSIKLDV